MSPLSGLRVPGNSYPGGSGSITELPGSLLADALHCLSIEVFLWLPVITWAGEQVAHIAGVSENIPVGRKAQREGIFPGSCGPIKAL